MGINAKYYKVESIDKTKGRLHTYKTLSKESMEKKVEELIPTSTVIYTYYKNPWNVWCKYGTVKMKKD